MKETYQWHTLHENVSKVAGLQTYLSHAFEVHLTIFTVQKKGEPTSKSWMQIGEMLLILLIEIVERAHEFCCLFEEIDYWTSYWTAHPLKLCSKAD